MGIWVGRFVNRTVLITYEYVKIPDLSHLRRKD